MTNRSETLQSQRRELWLHSSAVHASLLRRPKQHPLRRALFQLHLWTGVIAGLYLFVIGLSGALLVFRPEIQAATYPEFFEIAGQGAPLADPASVVTEIRSRYPDYRFSGFDFPTYRRDSFLAYVAKGEELKTLFLDPYTGRLIGELPDDSWLRWLQELHFNLHLGRRGIVINGIGAAALVVMALSGLIIWWPGMGGWARGLVVGFGKGWRRIVWELHGAVGIWSLTLLAIWGASGFYFSFPLEVRSVVGRLSPPSVSSPPQSDAAAGETTPAPAPAALLARARAELPQARPARYAVANQPTAPIQIVLARGVHGDYDTSDETTLYFDRYTGALIGRRDNARVSASDTLFAWLGPLHVGSFGGIAIKIAWCAFGLALPLLFVTGFVLWWPRATRWYAAARSS